MKEVTLYYHKHFDRDFHYLIDNLSLYIQNTFDCDIVYTEYDGRINIFGKEIVVADCELLIYLKTTDSFRCISFSDIQSQLISFLIKRNSPNDLIISAQHIFCEFWVFDNFLFKWKPNIYIPSTFGIDYSQFYNRRKLLKNYIDKFYFKGNVNGMQRNSVKLLENTEWFYTGNTSEHLKYLNETINYKVGLSIPGIGEICYRDIEYMAMGIPMMKFEYITKMNPELIPDYHYISIKRDDVDISNKQTLFVSVEKERLGGEIHIQKYIDRFLEVKDDYEFLEFISNNAKKYYDTYLTDANQNRIKHIINLLEL
jgi:hypothetical protein